MMSAQEVSIFAVEADQKSTKLINPGKTALRSETTLVNLAVEEPLTTPFGCFTITGIFWDVGNDRMIEAGLASIASIESSIGIEVRPSNRQALLFEVFESSL